MALPAIIAGMTLGEKLLAGGGAALYGTGLAKDVLGMILASKTTGKELSLQEKLMTGQVEGLKMSNEANRQAAAEYMQMLRDEKSEGRKDKNWDRRMQLVMMMLAGMNQFGRQAIDTAVGRDLPAPPMAMTTLLRGQ